MDKQGVHVTDYCGQYQQKSGDEDEDGAAGSAHHLCGSPVKSDVGRNAKEQETTKLQQPRPGPIGCEPINP